MENVGYIATFSKPMTYHEQRRQAEDLLRRNYTVSQIAKELGLQTRTVQRWAKELREGKPEPKAAPIVKAEVLAPQSLPRTTEPALIGYGGSLQDWVKDYNETSCKARKKHQNAQIAIEQKLLDELANNGSNRSIHTLSLALERHINGELKMLRQGRDDLLTLHQALALVQTAGFVVQHPLEGSITQSPKEIEPDDIFSDKLVDTEDAGENPEEHGIS
ncbi:MAG: helix-turn-helix domain-containing protein [Brasilonema angustatum HA4187-MV1]|jgi:transposase-like protein|nr:helix-turn-helix domain-containing protein [Brasilonema angustatum HA4187-MV1]